MEQLWFNILLRALITVYSANGIGNFIAFIPGMSKEDAEILGYNRDSSFQLTSSLIFCLLGIAQFKFQTLVYLTIVEVIVIVVTYLYLIDRKLNYMKWKSVKLKKIKKRIAEEIKGKMS